MPGTINPIGVGTAPLYPKQATAGAPLDPLILPGDTNPPILFEPPPGFTAGDLEVWIIATGSTHWGGCQVWISLDGSTYAYAGTIYRGGRQGLLTAALPSHADPDASSMLSVDLSQSQGQLLSGSLADADAFVTLCYCDGELLAFETATLTSAFHYDLTYLRRGVYGTPVGAHSAGASFARFWAERSVAVQIHLSRELYRPDDPRQIAGLQHLRPVIAGSRGIDADQLQPDRRRRDSRPGLCRGLVAEQPRRLAEYRTLHLRDGGDIPRRARRQLRRMRHGRDRRNHIYDRKKRQRGRHDGLRRRHIRGELCDGVSHNFRRGRRTEDRRASHPRIDAR